MPKDAVTPSVEDARARGVLERVGARLAEADDLDDGADRPDAWTRNFAIQLVCRAASKIGDVLASPRHVLVWWLGALGVPSAMVGALLPIREAGALLPQLWIGAWMRRRARRRGVYVAGLAIQAAAFAFLIVAAQFFWQGVALGVAAIVAIAVFSFGRSMASITSKDLLGRTIPKGRRGRLSGTASTVSGLITIAAGLALGIQSGDTPAAAPLVLIGLGVIGWTAAAAVAHRIVEADAPVEDGRPDPIGDLKLLREDAHFARFCVARGLLAGTVLAMPYVTLLAKDGTEGGSEGLGAILVAASAAQFLSGWFWGRLADTSSRRTMMRAGAMASAVLVLTFLTAILGPTGAVAAVAYGALFFLLGLAHTGIRQGRKTYVVDLAPDDQRPTYVAVANTTMGFVLLAGVGLGALSAVFDERLLVLLLAALGAAGAWTARGLREVESD